MRFAITILAFLFVAVLAADYSSTGANSAMAAELGATSAAQNDKAEAKGKDEKAEAAEREYPYEEKAEYIESMKKELTEIEVELDRLSAKVDRSTGDAKVEAKKQLDALREKWVRAKKHLDKAESATESDWDDVKFGVKNSFIDMKNSFEKTRQWLSDKIEP